MMDPANLPSELRDLIEQRRNADRRKGDRRRPGAAAVPFFPERRRAQRRRGGRRSAEAPILHVLKRSRVFTCPACGSSALILGETATHVCTGCGRTYRFAAVR